MAYWDCFLPPKWKLTLSNTHWLKMENFTVDKNVKYFTSVWTEFRILNSVMRLAGPTYCLCCVCLILYNLQTMQYLANSTNQSYTLITEHLQGSHLATGSTGKIRWDLGWEVIKIPNKLSYTMIPFKEVITKIPPDWFGGFQNFQYFKRNNTFPFHKKGISDQGSHSDMLFRRWENSSHTAYQWF